jgi:diguanylate cyclase (GGDEF)-like protein
VGLDRIARDYLFRNGRMLAMRMDPDLVIREVSPGCISALGYPEDELVGKSLYEFVIVDDEDAAARLWDSSSFENEVIRMRAAPNRAVSLYSSFYREDEGVLLFGEVIGTSVPRNQDVTIELHKRTFSLAKHVEELQRKNETLEMVNQRMRETSVTDTVTGLYKRNHLDRLLRAEWERAKRHNDDLTFLLVGVDGLGPFGDLQGAEAATHVVRGVARVLNVRKRLFDVLGHFDNETFYLILPNTSAGGGREFAERLVTMLENREIRVGDYPFRLFLSVGAAFYHSKQYPVKSPEELMHFAADGLLAAQAAGGNRATVAQKPIDNLRVVTS